MESSNRDDQKILLNNYKCTVFCMSKSVRLRVYFPGIECFTYNVTKAIQLRIEN